MDAQEIFDTVVRFLIKQGRKSIDRYGRCMYRGSGNTKCAVGCLIPDELYKVDMEKKSVDQLSEGFCVPDFIRLNSILLSKLQRAHDSSTYNFIDTFRGKA